MFGRIELDLETQKQMVVQAVESKISEGKMTDTEEDFWEDAMEQVDKLTKNDISPEKYIKQEQRKLRKIRRAEARIKERLNPKL